MGALQRPTVQADFDHGETRPLGEGPFRRDVINGAGGLADLKLTGRVDQSFGGPRWLGNRPGLRSCFRVLVDGYVVGLGASRCVRVVQGVCWVGACGHGPPYSIIARHPAQKAGGELHGRLDSRRFVQGGLAVLFCWLKAKWLKRIARGGLCSVFVDPLKGQNARRCYDQAKGVLEIK